MKSRDIPAMIVGTTIYVILWPAIKAFAYFDDWHESRRLREDSK